MANETADCRSEASPCDKPAAAKEAIPLPLSPRAIGGEPTADDGLGCRAGSQAGVGAAGVVLRQHRRRPDEGLVRFPDDVGVLVLVVELTQHVLDGLEPGPLLVIAFHHGPWGPWRVGVVEHRLLGLGVSVPLVQ